MSESYRGPEVCAALGITYRQLDYWARTGLLVPSVSEARGSGSARRYSEADLTRGRVIRRLLDAGLSLQSARAAVGLVADAIADGLRFLVVGGGVPMACGPAELERICTEAGVAVVVDLGAAA